MNAAPLLDVENLEVRYGGAPALFGVSISMAPGSALAVLGANGAGKSSLAGAIAGIVPASAGEVRFDGRAITRLSSHRIARLGLAHVPEHRGIFPGLSVLENVRLGLLHVVPRDELRAAIERGFEAFPRLADRRGQVAGTLSGGEQQMLSIGRALMARPSVLLLDEPSMGLSPILTEQIFEIIRGIHAEGNTVLLVEQNAQMALNLASRGYVLQTGQIILSDTAANLAANQQVRQAYLGEI